MLEHRHAQVVAAQVGTEAEMLVGLDRVVTLILQVVGADLVEQADAAAFLAQVEQHATAFVGNALERFLQLVAAIAAHREQCIASQALGMHPSKHRFTIGHVTQCQGDVILAGSLILETMHGEGGPGRGKLGGGNEADRHDIPR